MWTSAETVSHLFDVVATESRGHPKCTFFVEGGGEGSLKSEWNRTGGGGQAYL